MLSFSYARRRSRPGLPGPPATDEDEARQGCFHLPLPGSLLTEKGVSERALRRLEEGDPSLLRLEIDLGGTGGRAFAHRGLDERFWGAMASGGRNCQLRELALSNFPDPNRFPRVDPRYDLCYNENHGMSFFVWRCPELAFPMKEGAVDEGNNRLCLRGLPPSLLRDLLFHPDRTYRHLNIRELQLSFQGTASSKQLKGGCSCVFDYLIKQNMYAALMDIDSADADPYVSMRNRLLRVVKVDASVEAPSPLLQLLLPARPACPLSDDNIWWLERVIRESYEVLEIHLTGFEVREVQKRRLREALEESNCTLQRLQFSGDGERMSAPSSEEHRIENILLRNRTLFSRIRCALPLEGLGTIPEGYDRSILASTFLECVMNRDVRSLNRDVSRLYTLLRMDPAVWFGAILDEGVIPNTSATAVLSEEAVAATDEAATARLSLPDVGRPATLAQKLRRILL